MSIHHIPLQLPRRMRLLLLDQKAKTVPSEGDTHMRFHLFLLYHHRLRATTVFYCLKKCSPCPILPSCRQLRATDPATSHRDSNRKPERSLEQFNFIALGCTYYSTHSSHILLRKQLGVHFSSFDFIVIGSGEAANALLEGMPSGPKGTPKGWARRKARARGSSQYILLYLYLTGRERSLGQGTTDWRIAKIVLIGVKAWFRGEVMEMQCMSVISSRCALITELKISDASAPDRGGGLQSDARNAGPE